MSSLDAGGFLGAVTPLCRDGLAKEEIYGAVGLVVFVWSCYVGQSFHA